MISGGGVGGRGFFFSTDGGSPNRPVGSKPRWTWATLVPIPDQRPMINRSAWISTTRKVGMAEVRVGWDFGVNFKFPNDYL